MKFQDKTLSERSRDNTTGLKGKDISQKINNAQNLDQNLVRSTSYVDKESHKLVTAKAVNVSGSSCLVEGRPQPSAFATFAFPDKLCTHF